MFPFLIAKVCVEMDGRTCVRSSPYPLTSFKAAHWRCCSQRHSRCFCSFRGSCTRDDGALLYGWEEANATASLIVFSCCRSVAKRFPISLTDVPFKLDESDHRPDSGCCSSVVAAKKTPYRGLRFTTRESMFGNDLFKNETLIG